MKRWKKKFIIRVAKYHGYNIRRLVINLKPARHKLLRLINKNEWISDTRRKNIRSRRVHEFHVTTIMGEMHIN